jgi:UTP--glucose-1-phosphate uridylyltransferase
MDITKVVIPAAGFATNFLPFSKAVPKEMLPLLNKPAIQYVVEEGLQAGIKNFFIVTNKEKQAIGNHFDVYQALEEFLKETNKTELLSDLAKIRRNVNFATRLF